MRLCERTFQTLMAACDVAAGGVGLPPIVGQWLAPLVGRDGWRCFVAFDGQDAVAAAALYLSVKAAWFDIGATLPSHRRRGAQSALLAARIRAAAAEADCAHLATETGIPHAGEAGPSFKSIQTAGFCIVYRRLNYCLQTFWTHCVGSKTLGAK